MWAVEARADLQYLNGGDLMFPYHCDERELKEGKPAEATTKVPETLE